MQVHLEIRSRGVVTVDSVAVTLYAPSGFKLVNADSMVHAQSFVLRPGLNFLLLAIDAVHLNPGDYTLGLWLCRRPNSVFDHIEAAARVTIVSDPVRDGRPAVPGDGTVPCAFSMRIVDTPAE